MCDALKLAVNEALDRRRHKHPPIWEHVSIEFRVWGLGTRVSSQRSGLRSTEKLHPNACRINCASTWKHIVARQARLLAPIVGMRRIPSLASHLRGDRVWRWLGGGCAQGERVGVCVERMDVRLQHFSCLQGPNLSSKASIHAQTDALAHALTHLTGMRTPFR